MPKLHPCKKVTKSGFTNKNRHLCTSYYALGFFMAKFTLWCIFGIYE